jgi:hypothetical protein
MLKRNLEEMNMAVATMAGKLFIDTPSKRRRIPKNQLSNGRRVPSTDGGRGNKSVR